MSIVRSCTRCAVAYLYSFAAIQLTPALSQAQKSGDPPVVPSNKGTVKPSAGFTRGPEYTFVVEKKATVKRTAAPHRKATGATVAPDGVTYFIDEPRNGKYGGVLVSKKKPSGVFYATPEVHDIVFSPGSKYVGVLDDEKDQVTVLSVPDGKVVKQFSHAFFMRFRSDDVFQYRTDCQLYEVSLSGSGAAREIGPKLCGATDASMDGAVWIVVQPSRHGRVLSMRDFTSVTLVDGTSGKTTPVPIGSSCHDPSVSPAGKRVCFGNSGRLSCYDVAAQRVDALGSFDAARLDWEQNDQLMLGALGSEIFVVNFADQSMRKVRDTKDVRYWRFFPGGKRVYVYDQGSTLLDLQAGKSIEIYPKKTEVGGFVSVPGRDDHFMTGNEVGENRNYYWIDVTLPAPKPDIQEKSGKSSAGKSSKH